ncbi:MAG: flagellar hook-basal body complex protein [Pirellulales bacterium]|nr:flagellar hook-basal body complex protein [Pirellulales bacterium]
MGLASALSTALTGLTAAETTIDVVGNNVANASTVGFKSSEAIFATQFVQTQSLGSGPTAGSGGTNPRQIGLGAKVAEIKPDFTQGTIEVSTNPSDLAIQGDGFFVVQGGAGEQLYSRNGIFKTNAENELVDVNGNRLLGFGIDDQFNVQSTVLVPLSIPLGAAAVANPTNEVILEGTLRPNGTLADSASIIQSEVLGDAAVPSPDTDFGAVPLAVGGPGAPPTTAINAGAGALEAGTFEYRVVFIDAQGNESPPSTASTGLAVAANDAIDLSAIPTDPGGLPGEYVGRRIYRSLDGGSFQFLTEFNEMVTTAFTDAASQASIAGNATLFDPAQPPGSRTYSYRISYSSSLGAVAPSRPSPILGQVTVTGSTRVRLTDLPGAADIPAPYDQINIYRTLATDDTEYHLVTELTPAAVGKTTFIDGLDDTTLATNPEIDFDGPQINFSSTLLLDVLKRTGTDTYENLFAEEGTLSFTARKGGRTLGTQEFAVTATSTVQDLVNFMEDAMGIQEDTDPTNPIPDSLTTTGTVDPGGSVTSGRIQFVGNNGVDNSLDIGLSGLSFRGNSGQVTTVDLPFGEIQAATGETAVADFIVYDSLGIPVSIRLTAVQESRDGNTTTYRWFADSPDNQSIGNDAEIAVGTGLITFDGEGNVINVTESTVSVDRDTVSSTSPLEFELDFTKLSGLATDSSGLAASRQDGSPPGTLTSFIIGEDGGIRGVFSNGVTRDLGQVILARFANPAGLEQKGENLYASGVNSGLAIQGQPGEQGVGRLIAGAVELSNTDVGSNLIDLILASTQYRGNTRVIDAAQRLLDELLNLRR